METSKRHRSRDIKTWAVIILLLLGVALSIYAVIQYQSISHSDLSSNYSYESESLDIGDASDFLGQNMSDVRSALGVPSDRQFQGWDHAYRIGPLGAMGIDSEWLVLKVGQNGVITDSAKISD